MMDLEKLFETQRKLDAEIEKKHPTAPGEDRLTKRILALQTELGELANEWRGFKFWSENQKPRTKITHLCTTCSGTGDENHSNYEDNLAGGYSHEVVHCEDCNGTGELGETNPLLEEYVDCLHFVLSIGLELHLQYTNFQKELDENTELGITFKVNDITRQFNNVFHFVAGLETSNEYEDYVSVVLVFYRLGEMLGFTWEQIESAYYEKNQINHDRQANGY